MNPAIPIMAAILGGVALVLSIWVFKRTLDFPAYRELDSNCMEILKEGIEHPYLSDPKMVWNMCETVYDRKRVNDRWLQVIKTEKDLHLAWFRG
jgi:hypothetical protein